MLKNQSFCWLVHYAKRFSYHFSMNLCGQFVSLDGVYSFRKTLDGIYSFLQGFVCLALRFVDSLLIFYSQFGTYFEFGLTKLNK